MAFAPTNAFGGDQLLLRVQEGSHESFRELYELYHPVVRDFLISRAPSIRDDTVEDMVQEVFSRSWEYRRRFRGQSTDKTYLLGIARNVLREHLARCKRNGCVPLLDAAVESGSDGLARVELRDLYEHIAQAIENLSANQSRAIRLICIQGLSAGDSAKRCGTTPKAMRRRVETARERLRRMLSRCGVPCNWRGPEPGNCPVRLRGVECILDQCVRRLGQ